MAHPEALHPRDGIDAVTSWLRRAAQPVQTVDPEAPLDDLEPLQDWFGGAALVGLGEAVRGVRSGRELYQLKHRLLRLLTENLGFRDVALEDAPAVGAAVDEYIVSGHGNARTALAAAWTPWRTEEFVTTVEWLRSYNAAHAADPIRVVGVDGTESHALALNTLAYQAATGRRVVYWGGMGHVAVSPVSGSTTGHVSDGGICRQRLGSRYVSVGFMCHRGLDVAYLPPPPDHFVESILVRAGLDIFALHLRQEPQVESVRTWLNGPAETRIIGPHYDPDNDASFSMQSASLRHSFDVLVHVESITPASYLGSAVPSDDSEQRRRVHLAPRHAGRPARQAPGKNTDQPTG